MKRKEIIPLNRDNDIKSITNIKPVKVYINGDEKIAYTGETILSTLLAYGTKNISKNDHNQKTGAYCGMGICYCCTVSVGNQKKKACKTIVQEEMHIDTLINTKDIIENYLTQKKNYNE